MGQLIHAILNKTKISKKNSIAQILDSELLATYALTH